MSTSDLNEPLRLFFEVGAGLLKDGWNRDGDDEGAWRYGGGDNPPSCSFGEAVQKFVSTNMPRPLYSQVCHWMIANGWKGADFGVSFQTMLEAHGINMQTPIPV